MSGSLVQKKIAVIGGGAAGMMAACAAGAAGGRVTLYERNEKLGKKLYITGKGRCNLTNACGRQEFFENVMRNPRFLYSAFSAFDNRAAMDFFENGGCRLKTERGMRVFPVSDHASDVTGALARAMRDCSVRVRLGCRVRQIVTDRDGAVCGVELFDKTKEEADAVVLATGGLAYPATGSDGDGLEMARCLGHTVTPCFPSLVPFEIEEDWCRQLQGLALKNVELTLFQDQKEVYRGFGELLFTHFGISGPLVLSAASHYDAQKAQRTAAVLNLKPALSEEQLDARLLREFEEKKNRQFQNALDGWFPARLLPVMIALSGIDPHRQVNAVTRQERRRFLDLIRHLPLTVTRTRGFSEAVITRGGVSVKEVNPSTLESRRVKGLYFAGEILDVDALTGGFNLQIAWSTGRLAGESAAGQETGNRKGNQSE